MAALIGVGYQMVHKYERGMNRISAGHLHAIAVALCTDVAFFFEHAEPGPIEVGQQDYHRRVVELTDNVLRIANPKYRQAVCVVAKAMADRASVGDDES